MQISLNRQILFFKIKVITKLPNSEQSYKGKVKTHNYINRRNQSTTENCENRNDPYLVQAFLKKWWVESDFKVPHLPLSLRSKVPVVTVTVFKYRNKIGKIVVKAVRYYWDSFFSIFSFLGFFRRSFFFLLPFSNF